RATTPAGSRRARRDRPRRPRGRPGARDYAARSVREAAGVTSSEQSWARFDDLRAGTALRCPPPFRVLVAQSADDVVPVLAEVDRATALGHWAFGYVGYEAAPGFDSALPVHSPDP